MEYFTFELANGLRVIHKPTPGSPIAHCGLLINVGTRDEGPSEPGLAHFIEHAIFKGTRKRKPFHILSRLDSVGGELNAYTTKEDTCIYASYLHHHLERAIELLADICFHATFPEKEIEKEKEVVIDEIRSYQDAPAEQIFDEFEEQVFDGHPLGNSILGKEERLRKFQRQDLVDFVKRHYTTDNIVFSSVGDVPPEKIKKLAERYFGDLPLGTHTDERKPFNAYIPTHRTLERDVFQAHCILGNMAYPVHHPGRRGLVLLNNILGGPGSNSRLNLNIREKYGTAYHIESGYSPFSDTGLFSIYLGADHQALDRNQKLVVKEMRQLREKKLGPVQLRSAKQQLIGQIAMGQESGSNQMISMGKSLMTYGRVDSLENIYREIDRITAEELQDIANEVFDPALQSSLAFVPKN